MLIGEPYKAHLDSELLGDRRSCMAAVERWNQAHQHSRATSDEEKGRLFKAILDPSLRPDPNYQYRESSVSSQTTRPGSIGARVIIVSPFTCDYGYNIHVGDDAFIGANCAIEDAAEISIGSRVHIGKNVLFCGTEEPASRKGSQADLTAGAIIIEDEVNIGAGTIIMPHRVIGKGASVAAGSVVTRVCCLIPSKPPSKKDYLLTSIFSQNIPPYTLAAGNPCRVIKTLPRRDSRSSRELTAFTTLSGSVHSEEEHLVGDRQLVLENEASLRDMRVRRGIREQGLGTR
jgi:acetyltransferase-like isoleucine patch superfamily enzyme